jgi:hypothetical protein
MAPPVTDLDAATTVVLVRLALDPLAPLDHAHPHAELWLTLATMRGVVHHGSFVVVAAARLDESGFHVTPPG